MAYVVKNDKISIQIAEHGAELKSLQDRRSREYLWCGDAKFWGRTSPVLFPIVGSLKDKKYTYQGKTYEMGQHGFARDNDFTLVTKTEDSIEFIFRSNEETLQKYPFPFALTIGYKLDDNRVIVSWKVENTGENTMYFSIGAHPAFYCPLHGEANKNGYGMDFGTEKDVVYRRINADGLALPQTQVLETENGIVTFEDGFFDDGVYIVEGKQSTKAALLDPDKNPYITLEFDTPLWGTWSPEGKNAPFVCIEPWYGRCDKADFDGTLEEREYGNVLEAGKCFEASYTITVNQA